MPGTASGTPVEPDDTFTSGLEICYEVLLYLSSRMMKLKPGDVLEYITDDPDADEKILSWCDVREYTLLDSQPLPDGQRRFLIRK